MAELLCQSLADSGYTCVVASNGQTGFDRAKEVDLILADVMMPVMNGFEMVEALRRQGLRIPVIFLTAKDQTKDLVQGLEAGADDFLVKPFKLDELLARIKALLRRARESSLNISWDDYRMDCSKRTLFRGNQEIYLSPTEFALFELFLRRPEVVLPKALILEELWADDGYRRENIVETYVNYLRAKTEMNGSPRVIQTVRGRGYVLTKSNLEP